jgi:hypothetical protein
MASRRFAEAAFSIRLERSHGEQISDEAVEALLASLPAMFDQFGRAHLYARRDTHRVLGRVMGKGMTLAKIIGDPPGVMTEQQLDALRQLGNLMHVASLRLTIEARSQLGLEHLEGPWPLRKWKRIRNSVARAMRRVLGRPEPAVQATRQPSMPPVM